ncbi:MAG: DUF6167 family protein [Micrococcales bacterium]|nr:DUF6167 family protein [Micrococcales bacterium]
MRRGLWIALGLGLGAGLAVLIASQVRRATQALSPEGLGQSLGQATQAATGLVGEVRQAAKRREAELRAALLTGQTEE